MQYQNLPPFALPLHKQAKLAADAAVWLAQAQRTGATESSVMHQLASEHDALAAALDPHRPFSGTMAQCLHKAINAQLRHPDAHIPEAEIARGIIGILQNRIADEKASAALLRDPQFLSSIATLKSHTAQGTLPPGKIEEIARRLLQPNDEAGAEPPIHVTAGALGHYIIHAALAEIFEPNQGPLVRPLQQAILSQSPHMPAERADTLARQWLQDRYMAAQGVTHTTAPGGEAHQQALTKSEAALAHKHGILPSTQVATSHSQHAAVSSESVVHVYGQ